MAKKPTQAAQSARTAPLLPDAIKDSAHEIWLAGLAAFSKAQQEGSKMFDALVQEGLTIQRKTQSAAEEKISAATQKMNRMADEIGTRATGQWDKLESIFEDRVARALKSLGVPTAGEVDALAARLAALEKAAQPRPARTASVKKAPARKRPAARKTS
ncbi:phasin family protein [Curvibacter delicatus]|uniref:phasin family protein n=1 Tax=Curvibacter delicatus TaxID=80879 RepID=UPI0008346E79|nr:phasin family protein [Curvibacter delicatus]